MEAEFASADTSGLLMDLSAFTLSTVALFRLTSDWICD